MTSHSHIRLHPDLTPAHLAVLQRYLREAHGLSRDDWRALRAAVALLASSQVDFQKQTYTFHRFYATLPTSAKVAQHCRLNMRGRYWPG
jgi:hypothetical protein